MFNEYATARFNLQRLGLRRGEIDLALSYCKSVVRAAICGDRTGITSLEEELRTLCTQLGLAERIYSQPTLSFDEGAERIKEKQGPIMIGITGKPASGKTTILKYLSDQENTLVLDEFWPLGTDYTLMRRRAEEALSHGSKVIVASSQLAKKSILERYHLMSSPERRKENLKSRSRTITDQLRHTYFKAFDLMDLVLYESEAVNARFLVDSSKIKY
jgi:hypothetical protein